MRFIDSLTYAGSTIKNRKWRSFLTILGVMIGIAAIVAMQSLSTGFENSVNENFDNLSTDVLTIQPNTGQSALSFGPIQGGTNTVPLYENDTESVEEIDKVLGAAAVMQKMVSISHGNHTQTITIYGIDFGDYPQLFRTYELAAGENPQDGTNEAVLGIGVYDPEASGSILYEIGEEMPFYWSERTEQGNFILNQTVVVSGFLHEAGGLSNLGTPSDNVIYMNIARFKEWFQIEELTMMVIKLENDDQSTIDQVSEELKIIFEDGIMVITLGMMVDTVNSTLKMMTVFLTAIAGISLIVAGVGIMNIMTVSLMERTREIGILKAIGMKDSQILKSFILETIFIGLIGSIGGLGLGWLLALGAAKIGNLSTKTPTSIIENGPLSAITQLTPIFSNSLIIIALFFGVGISMIFGYLPARKAAKKPPVEALRYE